MRAILRRRFTMNSRWMMQTVAKQILKMLRRTRWFRDTISLHSLAP
jgi:hypothetical protein